MASIAVRDDTLVVELTPYERVANLGRRIEIPVASIRGVEHVDDGLTTVPRGIKTGLRVPRTHYVCTGPRRTFVAVRRGKGAVVVRAEGARYDTIAVEAGDPAKVASELRSQVAVG